MASGAQKIHERCTRQLVTLKTGAGLNATRSGVPIDLFHRYVDGGARFRVRVAWLYPMVDKAGHYE
jgi:hypothetical protein